MGRAHVLDSSGGQTRVVWHFTVPAGNNAAGVAWPAALTGSGLGGTTVLKDGSGSSGTISAAEKTGVQNGSVHEVVELVDIPPGMNAAQANAWLDEYHAARNANVSDQLTRRLRYWGYTRNGP